MGRVFVVVGMKDLIRSATTAEGRALDDLIRNGNTAQRVVMRARIVRSYLGGMTKSRIARQLNVSRPSIDVWIRRYRDGGITALTHPARRERESFVIDAATEARVLEATLHTLPPNATQWSVRTMAAAIGISRASVHRIWRKHGLKPHRVKGFKLSTDPHFVEKVRDVVGLYMNPPEKALVLSVDEKSQIQALDRTQPGLPLKPGRLGTMTLDYKRHGTTTLFAALNMFDGTVIGTCKPRHRQDEFLAFMETVEQCMSRELELHVILDNYSSHKTERVKAWLAQHPRVHFHFTPTSASWFNMVERFFSTITTKMIRRGVFLSVKELVDRIMDFVAEHNQHPKIFTLTKDADTILDKVIRGKEVLETLH